MHSSQSVADDQPRVLMSLRVSRDSGRTWEPTVAVREGDPVVVLENPGGYPPCECARCTGRRTVAARSPRRAW